MIKLIAGLGNPGSIYHSTRHNAGFWFIDLLAEHKKVVLREIPRFHCQAGQIWADGQLVHLIKPSTFMNRSGQALASFLRFYRISVADTLIVHDELDLPAGCIRLKSGGGSGGHNGLKDVIATVGNAGFWRLRIGIGHPRERAISCFDPELKENVATYVLQAPSEEERSQIDLAMSSAQKTVMLLLQGKPDRAMQGLHTGGGRPAT
jgi:peptidyl-tRNA hydrolase, PTH1 family